jgi:hypothetical protein
MSALLLTGCTTGLFSPTPATTVTVRVCPPLIAYSMEEQATASVELDVLENALKDVLEGQPSMLRRFMDGYGNLRARLKSACDSA